MDNFNTLEENIDSKITNAGGPGTILASDHNAILKDFARKTGKYTGSPYSARKEPNLGVVPSGSMFWNNNALNETANFIITFSKYTADLNDFGLYLSRINSGSLIRFKDYYGRSACFTFKSYVADVDANADDIYNVTVSGFVDNPNYTYQSTDSIISVFELTNIAEKKYISLFGNLFELSKHPSNSSPSLEVNDIVHNGYFGTTTYWLTARYIGGDKDTDTSWQVLNKIDEIPIT